MPVVFARRCICAMLTITLLAASSATAAYASPTATSARRAQTEALHLEDQIEAERENVVSLQQRVDVTNQRLFQQRTALFDAEARQRAAESRYNRRLVSLYKSRDFQPIQVLMSSATIPDLFRRVSMLSRLADADRLLVCETRLAASDAAYRADVLENMKSELTTLRQELTTRVTKLDAALKRQQALAKTLDARANAELARRRSAIALSRRDWKAKSLPLEATLEFREATVKPYTQTFLAATHEPDAYRSTGERFTAVCSWYGNEFHGRPTASGQIFNQNDFTCASKTLPFGTRLALTRSHYRIIVVVNDRGPFIPGRDLDLSKAAAVALGFSGVETIQAEIIEPLE